MPRVRRAHRLISLTFATLACLCVGALAGGAASAQTPPTCGPPATVIVVADNLSADAHLTLNLEGELSDPAATCAGTDAASYTATLTCDGAGVVRCGTISGLRPGAWTNRITVTVGGSAAQVQAQRTVFLGDAGTTVSNVLRWTVYPTTFVVTSATATDLRTQLDAAAAETAAHPGAVLVRFDRGAFPGAAMPTTIDLAGKLLCPADGRRAAICLTGSGVVVDALDATAEPGGVVLSIGTHSSALLRVYGSDNVLRGLVFQGSTVPGLTTQADTVSFVGAGAQRNRLERSIVRGPTNGDAVSAEGGPTPVDAADANVVADCELTGSEDRGLKVTTGAHVTIDRSCVHDNRNGGIQSTLGGHVVAHDNLVQHNVPGPSDNGFSAGRGGDGGERSTLTATGNIVRFSGNRGVSVVDNSDVVLADDYVADNQFAGARIETLVAGAPTAIAALRGVGVACNNQSGISGTCTPTPAAGPVFCTADADCCASAAGCCVLDPGCADPPRCAAATPLGFGAVVAACDGCDSPTVDLGTPATPGRNALTLNANVFPHAQGANLAVDVPGFALAARADQWEHCGTTATCDTAAVLASDVQLAAGASADVTDALAARGGVPSPQRVSIGRPRKDDLVRVFGTGFNAIDGADCALATAPVAACSAANPRVEDQNRSARYGNVLKLLIAGQTLAIPDVDAVTPTMLAFRMPFDCFAPATLEVSRRNADDVRVSGTIPLCDVDDCLDQPDGTPCDDHDPCSTGEVCSGGVCGGGAPLSCDDANPCTDDTCDPVLGCRHVANNAPCDDGNACTTADQCSAGVCQGGPALTCGPLLGCDPDVGCVAGARTDCRKPALPRRAPLALTNPPGGLRDALAWQWAAGDAASKADFGDPLATTKYVLSLYDASRVRPLLQALIPAGGLCGTRNPKPCWKETTTGFRYLNPAQTPNGIVTLALRAGEAGKASVALRGRGPLLALPTLPLVAPVIVQLESAAGPCWEADYDATIRSNDVRRLTARGD